MHSATTPMRSISTDAAQAAAVHAVAHATALGLRINVAVTDGAGVLMAFLRMSGAFLHSIDIAIDKAYTAASFRFATEQWPALLEGDAGLRAGMPGRPRLVVFGGGVPIFAGPDCVGGIGVSGASAEQDAACARAALEALGFADRPT